MYKDHVKDRNRTGLDRTESPGAKPVHAIYPIWVLTEFIDKYNASLVAMTIAFNLTTVLMR